MLSHRSLMPVRLAATLVVLAACTGSGSGAPGFTGADASSPAPAEAPAVTEASSGPEEAPSPPPGPPAGPPLPEAAPCGQPPDGMSCVPGGWYLRGVEEPLHACDQSEQPESGDIGAHPAARVWVDTFYLDRTEVTYEAYQRCVREGQCPAARPLYRDYDAPTQPMTGMSWFDAVAFCAYRGGRLPTEAEFEAASRGPDGELYPWGNEPATCERAIIEDERGRACGVPKRGSHADTGRIWEVASRPPGRYGLYDMVGNAEEWVADWWSPSYGECGEACSGRNPRGPCDGAASCDGYRRRVVRGGSWYWSAEHATGVHRRPYRPSNEPPHHFGFRCAVEITEPAALPRPESPR